MKSKIYIVLITALFSLSCIKPQYHLTYEFIAPGDGNIFIYTDNDSKCQVIVVDEKSKINLNVSDDFAGSISYDFVNGLSKVIIHNQITGSEHIITFDQEEEYFEQVYIYDFQKDRVIRFLPPKDQPKIPDCIFLPEERTIES